MPRRSAAQIRPLEPDARHRNRLVQQVINKVMRDGKKALAERIVYDSLAIVGEKSGEDAVETLEAAIKQLTPVLEVRSRRVGGATYQVPVEVPARRARTLAVRWLVDYAPQPPRVLDGRPARRRDPRRDTAAGLGLEAEGRHLPHGPGEQGLRPLPLVGASGRPWTVRFSPIDVDGVISLFGFDEPPAGVARPASSWSTAWSTASRCRRASACKPLGEHYDMVWATGWEEKANYYLPNVLGLPELPYLTFDGAARFGSAHWKLGASGRVLRGPRHWRGSTTASTRAVTSGRGSGEEPTLLVPTESDLRPRGGPTEALIAWAAQPRPEV